MSLAATGVLRRAALNAFRPNTVRAPPARPLATAPKKPAAELTFKEAWLSDPATYPIVVIISSAYPASVTNDHDPKSTSPYRGPCDRGAVVSWESASRRSPQAKRASSNARVTRAVRGAGRATFMYHTAAVIGCFSYCSFCLFCSPDVRISKTARSQVIRDWT